MNQKQALTIIAQLGGNGFKVMTGAKNFVLGQMDLPSRSDGTATVSMVSVFS